MALIRCPDCEREVSSRARACPKCGYPIESLTSLPEAIRQNDINLLGDLLRAGFKANETTEDGLTAVMLAVREGNFEATKLLVEHGAELNTKDRDGMTAYMHARKTGHDQMAKFLIEKGANTENPAEQPAKAGSQFQKVEPPPVPVHYKNTPPPLPGQSHKPRQTVGFVDDTLPVVEDEKYSGPGLICRTCKGQIAAEDIWCAHCKAPIIRRYCGGCRELIPDNAARCPYCNSAKLHRFRYIRHLEQFVAGAAVLAVLLFIFSIYGPNDATSYAEKLAQKRAQQQEQSETAAEEQSRKIHQERTNARSAGRVVARETSKETVVQAKGTRDNASIPTVERIESEPQMKESEQPIHQAKEEAEKQEQIAQAPKRDSDSPSGSETNNESKPSVEMARRLNAHGFQLMKSGRYAEAIPVLAQAVRNFPAGEKDLTYAYALYNLGRSLRLVGRPDLAIPILEERMRFADQRHIVARELEMAKADLSGSEPVNRVEFE